MRTEMLEDNYTYRAERAVRHSAAARDGHRLTRPSSSGEVVLAYLDKHVARLKILDAAVRHNKPDSVHKMRVTTRRLRSTLQSFRMILNASATAHLRDELRWLGLILGEARDSEVLSERLRAALASVPPELVLGPAQARVRAHFAPLEAAARSAVLDALDSERYAELLGQLDGLLGNPPLTAVAAESAGRVMPRAAAREYKRTKRRMRRARHAPAGPAREVALHETRKAAKRARYAAEAATPVIGKKARRFARRLKAVQSVLGDHHDAVNARDAAREIGVHAHLAGENAFSFGMLNERAYRDAPEYEEQAVAAWKRAAHAQHKWLG
jgi:CHAD domain-containing protein